MAKAKRDKKAPRQKTPRVRMKVEAMLDVKHDFLPEEKIVLGERLTSTMTTRANVEQAKKTMAKEYDGKLKILDTEIDGLHGKLRDGHEYRPTAVVVFFNKGLKGGKPFKLKGSKLITRKDDGSVVRAEPMSPGDFQDELIEVQRAERAKDKETPPPEEKKKDAELALNAPAVPEGKGSASTAATA